MKTECLYLDVQTWHLIHSGLICLHDYLHDHHIYDLSLLFAKSCMHIAPPSGSVLTVLFENIWDFLDFNHEKMPCSNIQEVFKKFTFIYFVQVFLGNRLSVIILDVPSRLNTTLKTSESLHTLHSSELYINGRSLQELFQIQIQSPNIIVINVSLRRKCDGFLQFTMRLLLKFMIYVSWE